MEYVYKTTGTCAQQIKFDIDGDISNYTEKLEEYQKDEYHCSVVKTFMHNHTTASVAVDYEF